MDIIESMLSRHPRGNDTEVTNAFRETMQEIALAGLQRAGFFEKAAFYGGTCLRIFHGLPRYSEDLDFSLLKANKLFSFEPYFEKLRQEFQSLGFEVEITEKQKTSVTDIASAFLKKTSSRYDLKINGQKVLKIKFEVDTDPPIGFSIEQKLVLQPYPFYVKCFALPDLFAGKAHALLFRQWQNRIKGRDWYDFEWYVRKGVSLNRQHLAIRAKQSGHWDSENMSKQDLAKLFTDRIQIIDPKLAREDVMRFIKNPNDLDIWSQAYFQDLANAMVENSVG
jgi:predicted nucleotidyltransferase component of viral defense system